MNPGALVIADAEDLYAFLAERILPRVRGALDAAGEGQRLRVTTLPEPVMNRVCERLQGERRWFARVLSATTPDAVWKATATKLVELRDKLREPLVVFMPPGQRTAAEDSLDIATFRELPLAAVADENEKELLERVAMPLRDTLRETIAFLREQGYVRNTDEVVDYLLTVTKNGGTEAAAGGALFVFGLLPDFELFDATNVQRRLDQNRRASEQLGDVTQPLWVRIGRLKIKPNTIQNALFAFLHPRRAEDVPLWSRVIACESAHRGLAFDRWESLEGEPADDLRLVIEPLSLPKQKEDEVGGTVALPVLNLEGKDPLKVALRSIPVASQAPTWKTFRIQILSVLEGGATVAWESNGFPKPQGRNAVVRRSIKVKDLAGLEEGTYFVKVDAYDADGALLTKPQRIDPGDPDSRAENESERFLVVRGDVVVEDPDVRAIFVSSLLEAWVQGVKRTLSAKEKTRDPIPARVALRGEWDQPTGAPPKGDVHFELKTSGFAGFSIVVPSLLRKVELSILRQAERTGVCTLDLTEARMVSDVELRWRDTDLGEGPDSEGFRAARREVFGRVLDHHRAHGAEGEITRLEGIVETVDLGSFADAVENYARSYVALIGPSISAVGDERVADRIRALALLDTVEVRWRRAPGDPGRALLLAPTHPVRLLWHLLQTQACHDAAQAWGDGSKRAPKWTDHLDQLVGLLPTNLPMVLFDRRVRGYVEHTPLTASWSLYLPDRSDDDTPLDAVAARDRVLRATGMRDRTVTVTTVNCTELAWRLFDYLMQHPYVDQLRINVFNPGDGRLIADVLRALEKVRRDALGRDAPVFRYAVHLFAPADHLDVAGDGLESLLDPERQVGEDDVFTLASNNHLLPKLVFSRNTVADFLQSPDRFAAHVSFLLEQFVARSRIESVATLRRGSFVGGLVQESDTRIENEASRFGWMKGLRPVARKGAALREELMRGALAALHSLEARFTTGCAESPDHAPVVALHLDAEGRALIRQVHDVSDWVLTVDKNLGLDLFDSPAATPDAVYLLDFAPEYLQEDRQRVLLTTKSTQELESIVRPLLEDHGLDARPGDEVLVLETLRSLSGRLALRLRAGLTETAEVVGLLLARWLLDRAGHLERRIVIPLDAHRAWFGSDALESRRRADLLLVGFEAPQTIRMDIVEVKLRDELNPTARSELYARMRAQTENTERALRQRFALDLFPEPRADALLRAKELASVLSFYIRRAERYGLLPRTAAEEFLAFVEHLDDGYVLDVRSLGVLFERKGQGSHVDEEEPGLVVYRLGGDKARQLLADAAGRFDERVARRRERDSQRASDAAASAPPSDRAATAAQLKDEDIASFRSALGSTYSRGGPRQLPVRDGSRSPPALTGGLSKPQPSVSVEAPPGLQVQEPATANPPEATGDPMTEKPPPPLNVRLSPDLLARIDSHRDVLQRGLPGVRHTRSDAIRVLLERALSGETPAAASGAPKHTPEGGQTPSAAATDTALAPDIFLGCTEASAQFGIVGKSGSHTVAVDLNGCNTISLFGVQGFGKSYTLGVVAEMATAPATGINCLPSPLATVIFHYHKSDAYEPEYVSAVSPNRKQPEVERLLAEYGARPTGLGDVVLLAPEGRVEQRRQEYPGVEVRPIKFGSAELGTESWKFLLGAYGNDSLYIRQLVAIMRRHGRGLTLEKFRREIEEADFPKATQRLAEDRVTLAAPYVDDTQRLGDLLRPGRTVIVDLRDEWIEKDEALGLFVVMLRIFAASKHQGREFSKLVVFDEAHKYISESELIGQVVETIREMRHQATSVVIASQDPLSVPRAVIELTSILVLHRMTSPAWLKHLKTAIVALEDLADGQVTSLAPGEALIWAQRSTEKRFTQKPQKVVVRPRFTQHGGGTKTAIAGRTVR